MIFLQIPRQPTSSVPETSEFDGLSLADGVMSLEGDDLDYGGIGVSGGAILAGSSGLSASAGAAAPPQSYLLAPSYLRPYELAYLDSVNRTVDPSAATLFARLCPYFRGRHTQNEIMWRENVSRRELALLLEVYKEQLVVLWLTDAHENVGVQ